MRGSHSGVVNESAGRQRHTTGQQQQKTADTHRLHFQSLGTAYECIVCGWTSTGSMKERDGENERAPSMQQLLGAHERKGQQTKTKVGKGGRAVYQRPRPFYQCTAKTHQAHTHRRRLRARYARREKDKDTKTTETLTKVDKARRSPHRNVHFDELFSPCVCARLP